MSKYRGHEHSFGDKCCNLLFLEVFEPDWYEQLKGKYTSALSGSRLAKKVTGYTSISQLVEGDGYIEVDWPTTGDVFVHGMNTAIVYGSKALALKDNKFTMLSVDKFNGYKIYRKVRNGD